MTRWLIYAAGVVVGSTVAWLQVLLEEIEEDERLSELRAKGWLR